jgi:magnesium chelatase family protein
VRNASSEASPCKKATHPCKCGFFGDPKRECRCSPNDVQRYRDRISGPLLDRIDIHVEVPAVQYQDLSSKATPGEPSASIRERITKARDIQRERFAKNPKLRCNARMSAQLLKRHCALDEAAEGMMKMAMTELNFSARAYDRILKVARTIADLASSETILAEHVGEAIQYRTLDRNLWA